MPRRCSVCDHPQRKSIESAMLAEPLRNIAKRFGTTASSLLRHKTHLGGAIMRAVEKREERLGEGLLAEMSRLKGKIWRQLEAAEQAGDRGAFAILARELRQTLGGYFELCDRAAKIRPGDTIRIHVLYHDGRDELPQTLDNGTVIEHTSQPPPRRLLRN